MTGLIGLFAIHISDGVLTPWGWAGFLPGAILLTLWSAFRISEVEIPRVGVIAAALYIASQLHVPAAPGVSVHLLLSPIAGVILGRRSVIAIAVAVVFQALLFAHGGVTTWAVNTLTMAAPALLGGWMFRIGLRHWPRRAFGIGLFIGLASATLTVLLAAAVVYHFGIESNWVVGTILLTHSPVIAIEGFITASLSAYIAKVKPEWLTPA